MAGRVQLVLVGGLPGTGKSTLAAGLERELGMCVVRSDELRKALGPAPSWTQDEMDFCRGLYAPAVTDATYERMRSEAKVALSLGESVVLDASWSDPDQRQLARVLAASLHADVVEIRCELPEEIAIERLRARMSAGGDASDATPAIAALMAARTALWPEAHTIDSTDASTALAQAVGLVDRCLPHWLARERSGQRDVPGHQRPAGVADGEVAGSTEPLGALDHVRQARCLVARRRPAVRHRRRRRAAAVGRRQRSR